MNIRLITFDFDRKKYNSKANHPLQAWEWGEARQELGLEIVRVGEFSGEELAHVYQLSLHPVPKTAYRIGYIPRSKYPTKEALEFFLDYGRKNNLIFIKFEPDEKKDEKTLALNSKFPVRESPHQLFPDWTQVLDISKSEDELLKNMKSKTRYNVRLAEKKGVVIKEQSDEKGFKIFSRLYFETCKRQKYFGHDLHFHQTIWNRLKNDISHILIAYYENTPLAAYELFYFNKKFYYTYGGTSSEYRNLMGANLLMWEAIKLGKTLGAESFDMWGSLPPDYDPNHPWSGFTRFKEGYGTQFMEMAGSYDLVIQPLLYPVYNVLYKARNFILTLKA